MKASYAWLRALVPGLAATPDELAARYAAAGIAVDAVAEYGGGTKGVVVATVVRVEPHPHRPKLRLVTIDRGGAEQRVVCGAPNVPEPGGQVCFAPLGTRLPAVDMVLAPRDIGGVTSEGMLCSEVELGLVASSGKKTAGHDDDDPGILTFPAAFAAPGTPLGDALPAVHDWIFELDLTPNRSDALGHVGLAREAAALFGLPFPPPSIDAPARVAGGTIAERVRVSIADTERCPRYGAAAVEGVVVGPSPAWLRYRLESLGVRAISNVVDVTNLVLLEFGHPMHAFDLDFVRGGAIAVRRAQDGEKLATLDGLERTLSADDLVIADGEGAVALAGVMGGASSEIRTSTKRVLLECAYFSPRGIRRSSRRHAVHTESSHRFERGVDPAAVPDVLAHAASLLTQLASGSAVPGSILAGPGVPERSPIRLRSSQLDALLGDRVPLLEARAILVALGFDAEEVRKAEIDVTPPTFRPDVTQEADLIDEVVRVRGLDRIPTVLASIRPQPPRTDAVLETRVRAAALGCGLAEAVTYGFVSPKDLAALGLPAAAIAVKNPLTEERSVMRTTLLPGLLEAAARGLRRGALDARLFAIGARFLELTPRAKTPAREVPSFAAIVSGTRERGLDKPVPLDVYDAKGIAIEVVERAIGRAATVEHQPKERRAPYLHPRAAADVFVGGAVVGAFGLLHPDASAAFELPGPVVVVELDLEALGKIGVALPSFRPIPALPASSRDIALVVHEDVTAGAVAERIRAAAGDLCESVELFDVFHGASLPADHRSLAFHVVYRDPRATKDPEHARTLTDVEVNQRHASAVEAVRKDLGATLRE